MTRTFKLSDFGRSFATRGRGSELRQTMLDEFGSDEAVLIDFADVTNVSYSFADEFIGRLVSESGLDLSAANMTPRIEQTVSRARANRTSVCG